MTPALLLLVLLSGSFPDSFINFKTFKANFRQETKSPYFPTVEDEGILIVDNCKFRFEYTTNEKRITICDCSKIYQINGENEEIFEYDLKELQNNPFLKLLTNRSSIKTDFVFKKISTSPVVYRLVPKSHSEDVFQVLKITLDSSETKLLKIEIIDENNQVITYKFSDLEEKKSFSDSLFKTGEKNE
jgi:outer membrane lipoprotein-sorting protein